MDQYRYEVLCKVASGEYETRFEADLGDGTEQELCEGGAQIAVTEQNRDEFIRLYLAKYFEQDRLIYDTIISGVKSIVPPQVLNLLSVEKAHKIAFAATKISAEQFISQLFCYDSDNDTFEYFKKTVREFTYNERQALLKFITGSSRLGVGRRIEIEIQEDTGDETLPIAHTCNESLDLPDYSSVEIMKQKIRMAMNLCGEIDDDGGYMSDYDQEGDDSQ